MKLMFPHFFIMIFEALVNFMRISLVSIIRSSSFLLIDMFLLINFKDIDVVLVPFECLLSAEHFLEFRGFTIRAVHYNFILFWEINIK